eukprot:TRINITY_DN4686_c0_g2_i2.p1 TRINITY_DN4686_c0_g2~~TRINITY_DN4686_c0_g2_i2.p1  ORF type:complete len:262 (-),score=48.90 TRINITY_DN4686_c0_g2_i2:1369-2154(-)
MFKMMSSVAIVILFVCSTYTNAQPIPENVDVVVDLDLGRSIGLLEGVDESGCIDVQPEDGFSCEDQASWGKCLATWMIEGGLCDKTCGRCEVPKTMKEIITGMLETTEVALTTAKKQRNTILSEAEELIQSVILQNEINGYQKVEISDILYNLDFAFLVSAAGVLYRNGLEEQCSGPNGAVLTTVGPDMSEWLLSVQLDSSTNNSVQFIMGFRVDCAVSAQDTEARFDVVSVKATFPNFVDTVENLYTFVGGVNPAQTNQI